MHIPDGYLSPQTCATFYAVSGLSFAYAFNRFRKNVDDKTFVQLSLGSAFSFLVMMFNFPVVGGSSAHITGIPLVTYLFGTNASIIATTVVLIIQALIFRDGGILALGVNVFNMAISIPVSVVVMDKLLKMIKIRNEKIRVFISSYFAINVAALLTSVELGLQPLLFSQNNKPLYFMYNLKTTIPAMMIPHLLVVGIVEAAISVLLYSYVRNFMFIKRKDERR